MVFALAVLNSALAVASAIPAQTTLPVVFTSTVSAKTAHVGEPVKARTTAPVRLSNGTLLAKGALVTGHVVETAAPLVRSSPDETASRMLAIQFDSIDAHGTALPLHAAVRAMASPVASWQTADVQESDLDPEHTTTQIGGDQVTPFEKDVVSSTTGDTTGTLSHGYVYAQLQATGRCDASTSQQSLGIFSASACGLYGMQGSTLGTAQNSNGPVVTLVSSHRNAEIHKNSEALLEEVE